MRCRTPASLVLLTVTTPEEADAGTPGRARTRSCLQGAEAGAHRGSLANDDRADAGPAGPRRCWPRWAAAPRSRSSRRAASAGPTTWSTCWPAAPTLVQAGHGVPALPRERRPRRGQGRAGRPVVHPHRRDPRLQRPPGPRPGQRHGAGAPGTRRPPIPRSTTPRVRCGRPRRPAGDTEHMSLYAGTGLSPGRGAAGGRGRRVPGVGIAPVSEPAPDQDIEFTAARRRPGRRLAGRLRAAGERLDQPDARRRRGGRRRPSRGPGSSRSSATGRRR